MAGGIVITNNFPKLKDDDMADLEKYTEDLADALATELDGFNTAIGAIVNNLNKSIQDLRKDISENTTDLEDTKSFIENSMKTLSTEGTSIHVEDSADYSCQLKVEGKSEQVQTENSPSPDYPSEIENVSGDLEVKAIARNILPRTFAEDLLKRLNVSSLDNYLVEVNGKNYFKYPAQLGYQTGKNYFIKDVFKENTQYVFKLAIMKTNSETSVAYNIQIKYKDGTIIAYNNGSRYWTNMTEEEVTIISDENKTIEEIGISYNSGTTYINLDKYILCKLEAGMDTNKIEYEPYKEQKVTFPFAEGQKLYKDGYLASDGIHNKRKQIVLDGTENYNNLKNNDTTMLFQMPVALTDALSTLATNKTKLICNYFSAYNCYSEDQIKNGICYHNDRRLMIRIQRDLLATQDVAGFKTWLAEQYANGTPVIVEYVLAEEETTAYTTEQQTAYNALQALKTYRTTTNISNNQDTNMELTYKMDLQTQFQEIEALVLESGV